MPARVVTRLVSSGDQRSPLPSVTVTVHTVVAQWVIGGIVLLVLVSVAAAGLVFVARRFFPKEPRETEVEMIGQVFAVAGVLYAIVLAFVVIDVWEKMSAAEETVYREAGAVIEQYHFASSLPDAQRSEIQRLSRAYVAHVLEVEWPIMRDHRRPGIEGDGILDDLRTAVAGAKADELAYEKAVEQGQVLREAREARLATATEGVPAVMWFVLIGGGLLMIGFVYLFDIASVVTQCILAIGLSVMTVLLLWSIFQMEYPFSRQLRIEADAFEFALARFAQMTRGG